MKNFSNSRELAKYFLQNVVVVQVEKGESQEAAWRRHLCSHPESAAADIKIFHYRHQIPPKPKAEANKEPEGQTTHRAKSSLECV